jgi:SNF2 family DNA or RNA helicase
MPPALFRQFQHDYAEIRNHNLRIDVLNDGPAGRAKKLALWEADPEQRPHIVLLSRDIFKSAWKSLYLMGFTNTHFDESHLGLQSEDSQIAKEIRAFIHQNNSNRLVLSTGTPIPNHVKNAYATLNLLLPEVYKTRGKFEQAHCVYETFYIPGKWGQPRAIQAISSYKNLDLLSQNLYSRSVYASKREVLNLEAPNIQIVECDLKPTHRRLYNRVLNERIIELEDRVIDARSAQELRQVALQLITVPEEFADNFKTKDSSVYETVAAIVDSVNPDKEKMVIFANYTRSVEALAAHFASLKPAIVYGPNGPDKNALEVDRFRDQNGCRLLIANPAAGGVGFKLGDVAKTVIFAEPVSAPGVFDQALSRVMLFGQTEPVVCYIIKVNNTISPIAIDHMLSKAEDINRVMKTKKSLLEALMGKTCEEA